MRGSISWRAVLVCSVAAAILGLSAGPAGAEILVTPDHITGGSASGTLMAIDAPYVGTTFPPYVYGGPAWTDIADYGFQTANSGIMELGGTSPWEPDGTPIGEAKEYHIFSSASPGATYTFDLPDNAVINSVYTTWATRNKDGTTWNYSESTSGSITVSNVSQPIADLLLKWTDNLNTVRSGKFQRLFSGPIDVTGGDGFRLGATKASQNAGHIDAVVIDYAIPTLYWDINSTAAGAGGATPTGNWGDANWNALADGTGATAAWSGSTNTACFGAGGDANGIYTVTVDGTRDIGGLSFEEGTVTLTGGTLRLTGKSWVEVASGLTTTIQTLISEDAAGRQLVKRGDGALILSGANTYSGATTVQSGTLALGAGNVLPDTAVIVKGNAPGAVATLDANGNSDTIGSLTLGGHSATSGAAVTTGAGTLTLGGNVTYSDVGSPLGATISGKLDLGAAARTFTVNDSATADDDLTVSADISGAVGLTKAGAGTMVLSGDNSYTGATTMSAGTLILSGNNVAATGSMALNAGVTQFNSAASINGTARDVTVAHGAVVAAGYAIDNAFLNRLVENANAFTVALAADSGNDLDLNTSAGASLSGAGLGATGDYTYTGTLTPSGTTYRLGGGGGTLIMPNDSAITGSGNSLVVNGNVTLSGANDYDGATTIRAGVLQANNASALGSGGDITFAGGTLQYTAASAAQDWAARIKNSTGAVNLDTNGQTVTLAGVIDAGNTAGLGKLGEGALILSAANAYTGVTTVYAGTLTAGAGQAGAFGSAPSLAFGPGSTGTVQLNGNSMTIAGLATNATVGTPIVENGADDDITLTYNSASNSTYAGVLQDGSGGGTLKLVKDGTGTLTLTNTANAYTGKTVIDGGMLKVSGDGALGAVPASFQADNITINNGATFSPGATTLNANRGIVLGTGVQRISQAAGNTTIRGVISGDGGLNIPDSAGHTTVLAAANTYTGATSLTGNGGLQFGTGTAGQDGSADNTPSITISGGKLGWNIVGEVAYGGQIQGSVGNGTGWSLYKQGAGTLTLTGASSFTGTTYIGGGTMVINSIGDVNGIDSSLGKPTSSGAGRIYLGNAGNAVTLKYVGSGHSSNREIALQGTTGTATIDASGSGALVLTSDFTATGNGSKTLVLTGSNTGDNTIGGAIVQYSGKVTSVTKDGEGKWILSGANAYTGATNVNGGTLLVNSPGSLAAGSAVTVKSGATLGGTGTIGGAVTVQGGGIFSPGASIGTLHTGPVTMEEGTIYDYDIGTSTTDADKVIVTGDVTFNGAWTVVLADGGSGAPQPADKFYLFTYDASLASLVTPTFSAGDTGWTVSGATIGKDSTGIYMTGISSVAIGDTNSDGVVDAADFITLKKNFGTTSGAGVSEGNFTGDDGAVNWDDLNILTNSMAGTGGAAPAMTPEPATLGLLALGALAVIRRRRR